MNVASNADEFTIRLGKHLDEWNDTIRPHLEQQIQNYQPVGEDPRLLEHHSRTYIIDWALGALGWQTISHSSATLPNNLPEVGADDPARQSSRRFFDYLGMERDTDRPLLLSEAKSPEEELPKPEASDTLLALITRSLNTLPEPASPQDTVVKAKRRNAAWQKHGEQVRIYLSLIKGRSGTLPTRVLITNGIWFLIIRQPDRLCRGDLEEGHLTLFRDHDEVRRDARAMWRELAYCRLAEELAPIAPHLVASVLDPKILTWAIHGVRLVYDHTNVIRGKRPTVTLQPFVYAGDGRDHIVWIEPSSEDDHDQLPDDSLQWPTHLEAMEKKATELKNAIQTKIGKELTWWSVDQYYASPYFEIFPGVRELRSDAHAHEFLVVCGLDTHFLRRNHEGLKCRYHDDRECREDKVFDEQHAQHVNRRHLDHPRHFFKSRESYFCGHRELFELRMQQITPANRPRAGVRSPRGTSRRSRSSLIDGQAFCELANLDTMLCCRACVLEPTCSKADIFKLPCDPQPNTPDG